MSGERGDARKRGLAVVPCCDAAAKVERVRELLVSESAHAVLYGVTGTHPESYGGVTKDEALECAGDLLADLRAALDGPAGGGGRA